MNGSTSRRRSVIDLGLVAVAFAALRRGIDPDDVEPVGRLARDVQLDVTLDGVTVDDVDATIRELEDRGVTVSPAREIEGVCIQAFFSDPAGNLIEINQPLG